MKRNRRPVVKHVKSECVGTSSSNPDNNSGRDAGEDGRATSDSCNESVADRRVLRSRYLALKTLILDKREEIVREDKFDSIFNEVESLHQLVQKPREQVADAEALLDITNTLVTSVKAQNNEGITVPDFVSCLLRDFGQNGGPSSSAENGRTLIDWRSIGVVVSHAFRSSPGCSTMIGPMDIEVKQRKSVRRKHVKPTESSRPAEVDETVTEKRSDTDRNMAIMFDILRKNKRVRLENLLLNRNSFAQTVENLFALSFLVKDGRAEIKVDDKGGHLVLPRNAPGASVVASGEVAYSHFIFRFDFKDWKLMTSYVKTGEELMPHRNQVGISSQCQADHRNQVGISSQCQADSVCQVSDETAPTTPIRKLTRNRGLVLQEKLVVENSPENDNTERTAAIRKGKRKIV